MSRFFLTTCAGLAAASSMLAQPRFAVTDLGVLPGADSSVAEAINDRGEVAGHCNSSAPGFNQTGFVWRDGVIASIGKLPQGNYSLAHSINLQGHPIGEGDTGNLQPQTILARNNTLLNLDPNGGSNIRAIKITDSGVIIGNYAKGLSGNANSWSRVIWTEQAGRPGRFRRVNRAPYPGGTSKARMGYAFPANNLGQIVGAGLHNGLPRAFLLTPAE